jgi:serine/threonine-protein kinase
MPAANRLGRQQNSPELRRSPVTGGTLAQPRYKKEVSRPADSNPGDPPAPTSNSVPTTGPGGQFDLLAEVGSGSSGTVYRARLRSAYKHLPAGTEVAVKFLRRELAADERAHARFFAEGRVGQGVTHANVAAIHGVETIEVLGLPITYLVMQYVHGTTLRDFIARSGAPVEDLTRRIGADAAAGLSALHRRGLVHRDIKPENLILTPDSKICIVDLGLARRADAVRGSHSSGSGSAGGSASGSAGGSAGGGRSSGGVAGSLAYTAPETLRGEPTGPRSDLYSLGIVLFEVTTGRHPFAGFPSADEMMHAHLHREPPRPSHLRTRVSPLLEQLLLDLLQKDPDRRPRDAGEVQRILEQGEQSEYWRRHEARAPALASSRRLLRMRRPAETPFFGRGEELLALDRQLAKARAGHGTAVLIAGPEGMGRRRLLDEAMAGWLEAKDPPLYLGGDADSGLGHGEPFASSLLDWLLRGDGRDSPQAAARAADRARSLLQLGEAAAEALAAVALGTSTEPPEVRADRLATALLQLPSRSQPLVLRVDHAEQLDTSGKLVLQRLLTGGRKQALLLLLVTGVDGLPCEVDLRLDLTGLAEDEFLEFGRALFRDGIVDEEFLRDAHQITSGLPGNLIEALDHFAQEGRVAGRAGDYHELTFGIRLRPAPSHVARFYQRFAGLQPAQRAVLAAAAVLGLRCQLEDLAELVGSPTLAVLEALSLFRGRIVRAQGGEVSFRHRDFQKALLGAMPPQQRHDLHLQAAAILARRGRSALEIGMHRSQALDHEGCLDPLLTGLEERVQAGSVRTALRVAGRIQVHLAQVAPTPQNEHRRLRFLLLAARSRVNAGQHALANRSFRAAEALARQLEAVEAAAAARTGIAGCELAAGRLLTAITLLESVHDELAGHRDETAATLAAQAHGLHGRILLYAGQAAAGLQQVQAALQRLPANAADLRCHFLVDRARLEALQHHFATALKTLAMVERLPQARLLPRVRLRLHLYRGQVRTWLGDEEAAQDLRFAAEEAERLSLPTYAARAHCLLGERQFWRRRDDEALRSFTTARQFASAGGDPLGDAMARTCLLRLGQPDPTLAQVVEELDLPALRCHWLLALGNQQELSTDQRADLAELTRTADLPLPLELRALALLGQPASARALVRSISERIPSRSARRRFLAEWGNGARI